MVGSSTSSAGLDTDSIKATALKDLLDVVDSVRGKKALVLDPSLTGPLGLIVKFSLLRDHGIDKVYHLESGPLAVSQDKIIYLCRPQQRNAEIILGMKQAFEGPLTSSCRSTQKSIFPNSSRAARIPRLLCPQKNRDLC